MALPIARPVLGTSRPVAAATRLRAHSPRVAALDHHQHHHHHHAVRVGGVSLPDDASNEEAREGIGPEARIDHGRIAAEEQTDAEEGEEALARQPLIVGKCEVTPPASREQWLNGSGRDSSDNDEDEEEKEEEVVGGAVVEPTPAASLMMAKVEDMGLGRDVAQALALRQFEEEAAAAVAAEGVQGRELKRTLKEKGDRITIEVRRLAYDMRRCQLAAARLGGSALDEQSAEDLQAYCLTFFDHKAITAELIRREAELVAYCSARTPPVSGLDDDATEPEEFTERSFYMWRAQEALLLYAPMAHTMRVGKSFWQYEDAALRLLLPSSYAGLEKWLRKRWLIGDKVLEKARERIVQEIEDICHSAPNTEKLEYQINGRTKSLLSTMKKLLQGGKKKDAVYDLLGLRIIVKAADEETAKSFCYRIRDRIREIWHCVQSRDKDYIMHPKPNGYQSLHSTCKVAADDLQDITKEVCKRLGNEGEEEKGNDNEESSNSYYKSGLKTPFKMVFEVQIRTETMDELAEHGSASHSFYKGGVSPTSLNVQQGVRQLRSLPAPRQADRDKSSTEVSGISRQLPEHTDNLRFGFFAWSGGRLHIRNPRCPANAAQRARYSKSRWSRSPSLAPKCLRTPNDTGGDGGGKGEEEEPNVAEIQEQMRAAKEHGNILDFGMARMIYKQLSTDYPNVPFVWVRWATLEREEGNYARARELFRRALHSGQDWSKSELSKAFEKKFQAFIVLQMWAQMEIMLGHHDEGKVLFEAAVSKAGTEVGPEEQARVLLEWALAKKEANGKPYPIFKLLQRAHRLDPSNRYVLHQQGIVAMKLGHYRDARKWLRRALKLDPRDVKTLQALGNLEASKTNFEEARELYATANEIDPRNAWVLQSWAVAEGKDGKFSRSRTLFEQAHGIDPENIYILQAWAKMEEAAGKLRASVELLEHSLRKDPLSPYCLQALGSLELRLGHKDRARNLLQQALALEPQSAAILMECAKLEEELGNVDLAREFLLRAEAADLRAQSMVYDAS